MPSTVRIPTVRSTLRRAARHAATGAALLASGALGAVAFGAVATGALTPRPAAAQWVTTFEQFYLPAEHNWRYRRDYPFADRLFNAFDYGHSILYEELYTKPNASPNRLEYKQYNFLTRRVLPNPPRVPLEEVAIEIQYARLAPEAKQMFEWAHVLHRQAYDILADERLDQAAKDREMARLLAYYKSRPDVKFSSVPKSMKLMQEQPYSLAFRKAYPKFNGLIWGYHWMQVGLYEPLLVGRTFDERQALSTAAVARFRQMLQDAPRSMPYQMPMTAAVAPEFARRYPEYAIIFDNLHSMHDVVSDILANDSVPRSRKRPEIMRAVRLFKDDTSYVMGSATVSPAAAWRAMSQHMGQENMGGPAVGFTPALPTPTVTYGAVMTHDDRTGEMVGFKYGQATPGGHADGGHAGHGGMPGMGSTGSTGSAAGQPGAAPDPHAGHQAGSGAVNGVAPSTPNGTSTVAPNAAPTAVPTEGAVAPATAADHAGMGHGAAGAASRPDSGDARPRATTATRPSATGASLGRAPVRRRGTPPAAARPARPASPAADPHAGHGRTPAPASARTPARPVPRDPMAGMDHGRHPTARP